MVSHIEKVRKIKGLGESRVVFIPESNLAWEGFHQSKMLKNSQINNVVVMKEDSNRAGIKTTNSLKELMVLMLRERLGRNGIAFHKDFISIGDPKLDTKKELLKQLFNFCEITKPSKDPYKRPTVVYSGKGGYGLDDMVMSLMLNLLMKSIFFSKKETYGNFY